MAMHEGEEPVVDRHIVFAFPLKVTEFLVMSTGGPRRIEKSPHNDAI